MKIQRYVIGDFEIAGNISLEQANALAQALYRDETVMPKKPKMSDMVAHVVDVVTRNHRVNHNEMRNELETIFSIGFSEANEVISKASVGNKKLIRSDGSSLRPLTVSKLPHVEQDNMTGWWGIYVDGDYKGQRPEKSQAEAALKDLLDK